MFNGVDFTFRFHFSSSNPATYSFCEKVFQTVLCVVVLFLNQALSAHCDCLPLHRRWEKMGITGVALKLLENKFHVISNSSH